MIMVMVMGFAISAFAFASAPTPRINDWLNERTLVILDVPLLFICTLP